MLIPSYLSDTIKYITSLSRRVNANSQRAEMLALIHDKLIKKGEC